MGVPGHRNMHMAIEDGFIHMKTEVFATNLDGDDFRFATVPADMRRLSALNICDTIALQPS